MRQIPKLQVKNPRSEILSRVIKSLALLLKSREFLFSVVTRAASSESVMLCCCGGGGSGRVVVVVDVVVVKTGA
ncbi:hypothetical protein Tco_1383288 [Tanacetum coccineum]